MNNPEKRKASFQKGQIIRWTGTIISMILFVALLSRQDWQKTWESLSSLPPWILPLVAGMYFSALLLRSFRWSRLLVAQGVQVPFGEVVKMVITGAFASNFFPSTIGGDTFRIISLTRFEVSWTLSAASVVMDRFINIMAMLTFVPFTFLVFGDPGLFFQRLFSFGLGIPALVNAGIVERSSIKWWTKLRRWVNKLWSILKIWLNHPDVLLFTFIISWLSTFVVYSAVYTLAHSLGMPVNLYQVMGVMALIYAVNLLPISINSFGVREVALTTLYMHLGATLEQASTVAVVTRFILLLETLPGALWLPTSIPIPRESEKNL